MDDLIKTVICKKTYSNSDVKFIKGKQYHDFSVEENNIPDRFTIFHKNGYKYKFIFIYDGIEGNRFHLDKNNHESYLPNFYDYFYSDDKEVRTEKLKKINKIK
jgi:hypothetical protein